MTRESGNTKGLELVDFRHLDLELGTLGLLDHLGQDLFLANQAGWGVWGAIAPR